MIYIRSEINPLEKRTPLVPNDVKKLLKDEIEIYVQSSVNRVYCDEEYEEAGAIIVKDEWFEPKYKNSLIVGLKELCDLDKLDNNVHMYFSHSFKNQSGSEYVLKSFKSSNSVIFDFEYFQDPLTSNRLISFGIYAGYVGAILGIKQFYQKYDLYDLQPWNSIENMIASVPFISINNPSSSPKVGIIGYKGRCGTGVREILDILGITYICIDEFDIEIIKDLDIFYNCICLDKKYNKIWFNTDYIHTKKLIIVDISCDYNKPNNPIKIYNRSTTHKNPVYKLPKNNIEIIAIDNLPTLLPKDSSDYFSNKLVELLDEKHTKVWLNNLNIFDKKMKNIID